MKCEDLRLVFVESAGEISLSAQLSHFLMDLLCLCAKGTPP